MTAKTLRGDRCLCRTCGEYFNSTFAFDKHRVGKHDLAASHFGRRCLTEAEMTARGMARNQRGFWISSASPAYVRRSDDQAVVGTTPQGPIPEAAR